MRSGGGVEDSALAARGRRRVGWRGAAAVVRREDQPRVYLGCVSPSSPSLQPLLTSRLYLGYISPRCSCGARGAISLPPRTRQVTVTSARRSRWVG